jgi:aldose sugar dehydrogenase
MSSMITSRSFIVFCILCMTIICQGQKMECTASTISVKAIPYVTDIEIPWGMTWLPDGSMLITERSGTLFHFANGQKTSIGNLPPLFIKGQGGLLDVTIHPDYQENGWVYLAFSTPDKDDPKIGSTALIRAKIKDNLLTQSQWLYSGEPKSNKGIHFGTRLVFDRQGYLFFGIGDRGDHFANAQDIHRDGGKIYRIHDDGSIPRDNPFVDSIGARSAIYSYGHRNPQGMFLHPVTGQIWENEHGPQGGDEINIIRKGANYGWPVITYGINYDDTPITYLQTKPGMESPVYYYIRSIAPSGFAYLDSDKYPGWQGSYFVGSLSFEYLERLEIIENKVTKREKILDKIGRVRCVKQGPDGYLYISVEGEGILKLLVEK